MRLSPEEQRRYGVPAPGLAAYYMAPDENFNLQINQLENREGQVRYQATVSAFRYGIWRR